MSTTSEFQNRLKDSRISRIVSDGGLYVQLRRGYRAGDQHLLFGTTEEEIVVELRRIRNCAASGTAPATTAGLR